MISSFAPVTASNAFFQKYGAPEITPRVPLASTPIVRVSPSNRSRASGKLAASSASMADVRSWSSIAVGNKSSGDIPVKRSAVLG